METVSDQLRFSVFSAYNIPLRRKPRGDVMLTNLKNAGLDGLRLSVTAIRVINVVNGYIIALVKGAAFLHVREDVAVDGKLVIILLCSFSMYKSPFHFSFLKLSFTIAKPTSRGYNKLVIL